VEEHRAMVEYGDGQMIAAQLAVRRGRSAIEFYKAAFAAVEDYRVGGTDDEPAVVAQLSVGKTSFWVADESPPHDNFSPESLGGSTTRMLLIAEDPQGVIDRAVAAGATEIYPASAAHGWLLGRVKDPFGHHWEIGRPLINWPPAPERHAQA
jgi:PhnB protein